MSAGADQLRVTQPAVSMQMKQLQRDLSVVLFRQVGKRLELTEAGAELLTYADRIVNLVDEARLAVEARAQRGAVVRVAASSTPGVYLMPQLIAAFRRIAPRTSVQLQVGNTETVEKKVRAREADFGVVGGRLSSADLQAETWTSDEMVLIVPPKHRLSKKRSAAARAIAREHLLAREQGSATRITYEAAFLQAGIPLPEPHPLGDTEAIKRAVAAGMGVAIVSRFAVGEEVRARRLSQVRVKGVSLSRPLQLVYISDDKLSPAATQFLEFLREKGRTKNYRESRPGPGREI